MFVMDMPDLPPQYAQVMIVQAGAAKQGTAAKVDRTIGVCSLVQNPMREAAFNEIGPMGAARIYFRSVEGREVVGPGMVTVLSNPQHGTLKPNPDAPGGYLYLPKPGYFGPDRASFLVEMGGKKIRTEYFFNVLDGVADGDYQDKKFCPNGKRWKISLSSDLDTDPLASQDPAQWGSFFTGVVPNANLSIADLAPMIVAQASQAQISNAETERIIGVCQLIQNPPIPPLTAVNAMSPVRSVSIYYRRFEHRELGLDGKVGVLKGPEHGELKEEWGGNYRYNPAPSYYGPDGATLLVEIGGRKVKVVYFFKVQPGPPGGTEGYDPYRDKQNCPNGEMWKISLSPDDPNAGLFTFERPTAALAGSVTASLAIADLAGGAVGEGFHGSFLQDEATMFVMDIPDLPTQHFQVMLVQVPDVPPQYAPAVIAQASQPQKGSASSDPTIGICHLIENPPVPPGSAVNGLGPVTEVWGYLKKQKRFTRQQLTADMYNAAKVSIPERPKHGRLEDMGAGDYYYHPTPGYSGPDQATFVVEMGGLKVKVLYFFNVLPSVGGGGAEGYDPHDDKKNCPQGKGRVWNISLGERSEGKRHPLLAPANWSAV